MVKYGAHRIAFACLALALPASPASAQEVESPELTLEEAIATARQHNPAFQAIRNDRIVADWDVKSAYGSLLPSVSANAGVSWQGAGEQRFGGITAQELGIIDAPAYYFSSYNLAVNYVLDGRTVLQPGQAKSTRRATSAEIRNADAELVLGVTQGYLNVLLEQERLRVAQEELERAEYNVRLAQGRREVGSATIIDVQQAEVAVGRAEVAILVTSSDLEAARYELLRRLGRDLDRSYDLTTGFELFEPDFDGRGLYDLALDMNPTLNALRANRDASDYGVRMAKSAYLPRLTFQAGIGGFTRQASNTDLLLSQGRAQAQGQMQQCAALNELFVRLADPLPTQDCGVFAFDQAAEDAIRAGNSQFPFDFTTNPAQMGLTVSLPIYQGLNRKRDVEAARVQRDNFDYRVREQQLALQSEIGAGLARLRAAYESAVIEQRNQALADEQLRLAREQYQLGFTSFVELVEAETVKAQADRELIAAVFAYHGSLATLEATVGTSLRD